MVRETRHLWVGNLPDNIREDRIREHFKRYGRVQNIKLLGRTDNTTAGVGGGGASGNCATVAFMDIKSASKAHNAEHVLDERTLTTEYYEPAAIPTAAGAPSAGSSPAGSGYSGSSSSVNSAPAPTSVSRYHLSGGEDSASNTCPIAASAAAPATWRGTNDSATEYCRRGNTPAAYGRYQRNNSTAPYSTPPSNVERTTPHHRWYASGDRAAGATGGESTPSTPGGGTEGGRRRRHSGSGSSRSDSSSPEPSDTSRASTPATQPPLSHHSNHRTPPNLQHQWASTASGRPLAICVRNLPTRSTDSSLKDGLYHEYKKHGKVMWVKVVGQNADRYAVVRFKKPSDVEKALEVSQDKLFFGCKISVAPHQSCDEDADSAKPYETDIDEYHPKATRTLFIGNLEKDVTQQQLRDKFKHFGRIIEIDIKKGSSGGAGYAFCQYASISSVVEAIRAMDGEYVGGSRVKLGFGKPVATTCVWVDGLTEHTEKQVLSAVSRCGGATSVCVDRAAGAALVHFEQAAAAGAAVRELRRVAAAVSAAEPDHPRLCVDYASRECQEAFYEQLEKHGGSAALTGSERLSGDLATRYVPSARHDPIRYEGCGSRSRASSYGRASSRTPRYPTVEHYDPADYAADRRYRVYDEVGSSPQAEDAPYEERLQSVVVSPHRARRHRRDSSPEDRKHSKERHRSVGARRSRSGSRGAVPHVVGARRRHRRRRDGSGSHSRAGTPLRDEPDAPPAEPRRPRERPPLPMSLPLPKFAAQLLRAAPPAPRPAPAPAPDSPPRPPSVSSSSGGSAPHSPSLEERIRSLDEKLNGSRALTDAPDRTRLRHRLLDVDINEVKPSEVVRSLLAKRSVFDEDSERLEGAGRAPSPTGRSRAPACPRALRYPFPAHPPPQPPPPPPGTPPATSLDLDTETKFLERPRDAFLGTGRDDLVPPSDSEHHDVPRRDRDDSPAVIGPPCETIEKSEIPPRRDSTPTDPRRPRRVSLAVSESAETSLSHHTEENTARDVMDMLLKHVEKYNDSHCLEVHDEKKNKSNKENIVHSESQKQEDYRPKLDSEIKLDRLYSIDNQKNNEMIEDHITKELIAFELQQNHLNSLNSIKISKENTELKKDIQNSDEKLSKDRHVQGYHLNSLNSIKITKENTELNKDIQNSDEKLSKDRHIQGYHITKLEKDTLFIDKSSEREKNSNLLHNVEKKFTDIEKCSDERIRLDRDKIKSCKERLEKEKTDEKHKINKTEKHLEKRIKEEHDLDKNQVKNDKDLEKSHKEKSDKESDKSKHVEDKSSRHDHHRKERSDKDKRKDSIEIDVTLTKQMSSKKDDKHKHERSKKDADSKRESKKDTETVKNRKTSRDESTRDLSRKDSTDSSTSRASHESSKLKDLEHCDNKEDVKPKNKHELLVKHEIDPPMKTEIKEEKDKDSGHNAKIKHENVPEQNFKCKPETIEKQRHYSLDSPNVDSKRKERLNSCSSLPPNIGIKRRMSSHDSFDSLNDEVKKYRNDITKIPERRDSKDSRTENRHKTPKFSKGHFAKIIESKTKDDKKNQVKPPDDSFPELKENDSKEQKAIVDRIKTLKKSPKEGSDEITDPDSHIEGLRNDLDFLATLELRSSEEDERQRALRKELKEKKRIQQLQQIQELQSMQHDALQQAELIGKLKDDKKPRTDEKKRENARDKRMSTDRKSRDEKIDSTKRKNRRPAQTSDSSDSDEPKKHSIFDIIDDEPTYISMYDKVKARSCKNMQKQEEEKRQEKIKAKFSQLKQSRAKREEKKRSSWDEDSDSEQDRKKPQKSSLDNSTDDENIVIHTKKRDKCHGIEYDRNKVDEYFGVATNEEDLRNKLSRKNSRSRIMSDTSDDEMSKRSISKSPNFFDDIKKENLSDSDPVQRMKTENKHSSTIEGNIKNSLLTLFGKSDSDDSKVKLNTDHDNGYTSNFIKSLSHDFSSENESLSNRNSVENRRRHKKKQKKHKTTYSDDEMKIENSDTSLLEADHRNKNSDKQRRHNNKKEKRKDKSRESVDADDNTENKVKCKKEKRLLVNNSFELPTEPMSTALKKDGKMEDIFGPLSDESDRDTRAHTNHKSDYPSLDIETSLCVNNTEFKIKDKDENKRRKEKKRKEKRYIKEDDNSLDVDAVSKAIEARLFAETLLDDENRIKVETLSESISKIERNDLKFSEDNLMNDINKHDKLRKECKEKRKKKKRSKEDRQSRRDHHHFHQSDKNEKLDHTIIDDIDLETKTKLLDIPLPSDTQAVSMVEKVDDSKPLSESHSLPRLTDSPPIVPQIQENTDMKSIDSTSVTSEDTKLEFNKSKEIEIEEIPMPPPFENIVTDISEVPLPKDPIPPKLNHKEDFMSAFNNNSDFCENAVRNITNSEKDLDKITDKGSEILDLPACKLDKKTEEKPRAIISQEETADAVAALLGESFGGNINTFVSCYEEPENNSVNQNEIEDTSIETETILEEDAEEMRQAVQNLNASEMELKPDTPVSDNDLLLIDTDTEEADETPQDAIDKLPVNIIATNQALNALSEQAKGTKEVQPVNTAPAEPKSNIVQPVISEANIPLPKTSNADVKVQLVRRDNVQVITSTATPVITSWTLPNNKLVEPHVLNVQANSLTSRDKSEIKPTHITANIVQIKGPQNQNVQVNNSIRPIVAPTRVSAPYQVINQMIRSQTANMQPPTIKIPEPHILYSKPQGIVISPRMSSDPRMQSPKASPQGESMTSPRLASMAILSSPSQNLNPVGMTSPNSIQQRSPGQVTVVRMQQPPLSPIQAMHIPHGARTMLSPNRPNSVLVQTQGTPIHFNRLPVTPVLAPISKQMNVNLIQQNKGICVTSSPLKHQQIYISGDCRKIDQRGISENLNDNKIILSPTSLQHGTNATVMAQNRLLTMQSSMHVGNVTSPVHLSSKVLINTMGQLNDKRESQTQKTDQLNHIPFASTPIIHVTGVSNSTPTIIQSGMKAVTCNIQESNTINRSQGSNVIHTLNSQRILTQTPANNIIHMDSNKGLSPVLPMATIRPPSVLAKLDLSNVTTSVTTSISNVSPLLVKTTNPIGPLRSNVKIDKADLDSVPPVRLQNHIQREIEPKVVENTPTFSDSLNEQKDRKLSLPPVEHMAKSETDFEELLKDNTNEIKITNDPEKKLEVNVGKTVTLFPTSQNRDKDRKVECLKKDNAISDIEQTQSLFQTYSKEDKSKIQLNEVIKVSNTESQTIATSDSLIQEKPSTAVTKELLKDNKLECNEPQKISKAENISKTDDNNFFSIGTKQSEMSDNQTKNDENDSWSAKDVNIESVIKKVDSLCNENIDINPKGSEGIDNNEATLKIDKSFQENLTDFNTHNETTSINSHIETNTDNSNPADEFNRTAEMPLTEKMPQSNKRGGRNVRGKKNDKNQDRIQTRQISKPSRGTAAKRGRGRAKVDKKLKNLANNSPNTMPGDVYDFHEDSGDETTTSPNKTETRPRLILTIKSPLSGHSNVIATSTLSIAQKEQQKTLEKVKEDKAEDFISPSPNTRKSRRLQEKDVQRSTVDDVIEDVIKGTSRTGRDGAKRRTVRQAVVKANVRERSPLSDTRKSPRGVKRTHDRSLSDASLDSGDERLIRRDDTVREAKVPRVDEPAGAELVPPVTPTPAPAHATTPAPAPAPPVVLASAPPVALASTPPVAPAPAPTIAPAPTPTSLPIMVLTPTTTPTSTPAPAPPAPAPAVPVVPPPTPTPITKPPKKMISEISAKLACAFEAACSGAVTQQAAGAGAGAAAGVVVEGPAALAQGGGEALRRRADVPGAALPVGTEATDARVQSPALPHRPPSVPDHHRPADRATPLLIRGGEGEGAGVARAFRGYAATASLPRGAHHPAHPPPDHHAGAKQVAVVGPQPLRHHAGAGSRVTLASVPSISPQGQITLSADLVRSPPPAHQQTSPVTSGDGMYPHFSHQHYQMYQQHFRATQHESRGTPSPYRSLEAEGCEAPAPSLAPPLELRRVGTARVARAALDPYAESPYPARALPPAPPPAHSARPPAAHPPPVAPGPPHASQVPLEADSLQMLLRRYPVMWQGLLALKNDSAAVQMHFVGGNPAVAGDTLARPDGAAPALRIAQRMRLEPLQLDQVHRKMKMENEHCMLLALPCGRDHMDVLQQSTNLTAGFITYLQRKQAAGIVNIAPPGHQQAMFTVHIFPSCDFANENLNRIAPDLMHRVADIAHLLIVIATV